MASFVIVDTYFRESGHNQTLNRMLHQELARIGVTARALLPRSFSALRPDYPAEARLPDRSPSGTIADRVPYSVRLFWSLLTTRLPAGTTIFWPIPGVAEVIAGCLLALFKGCSVSQIFWLQIPFWRQGHNAGDYRAFHRADRLNRLFNWRWRFIPTTDTIGSAYADIGVRDIEEPIEVFFHIGQSEPASTEPCALVYLGEARDNKGFHLVMDMALLLRAREPGKYRFIYQVQAQPNQSEPLTADCLKRLAQAGAAGLELHYGRLSAQQYLDLLGQATYVLLPYDPAVYSDLPSGICGEAWAAGRPVIATRGSWSGKLVESNGCGLLFDYSRPQQFLETVEQAWNQRTDFIRRAWEHRLEWRESRTPEHFVRRLMQHAPGANAGNP